MVYQGKIVYLFKIKFSKIFQVARGQPGARLQNSCIFGVGLSNKCVRSLNERSGASVKMESRTGERRADAEKYYYSHALRACEAHALHTRGSTLSALHALRTAIYRKNNCFAVQPGAMRELTSTKSLMWKASCHTTPYPIKLPSMSVARLLFQISGVQHLGYHSLKWQPIFEMGNYDFRWRTQIKKL